ncbi:MAG TPA: MotA/TolQ/ExbB proton channel family protein [Chthoniobacterales bacterium]|jgi:biopolymer transport protein ExbB
MNKTKLISSLLLAGAFLLSIGSLCAAEPGAPAAVHTKTLFEQLKEGGWVMFPIAICSMATVYLIGDGILRTGRKKIAPLDQQAVLKSLFQRGDYLDAYDYCRANPSVLTNVTRAGLSLVGDGAEATQEAITTEVLKENSRIQTMISYLSVIGVCTPMIGLLGTVTGMIKAFATLGSTGIGDPSSLSAAIGEVLVATASGLFIAIPAFGAYYFLRNRAAAGIHDVQDVVARLFRKMPYEAMPGVIIGENEPQAGWPSWLVSSETVVPVTQEPSVA